MVNSSPEILATPTAAATAYQQASAKGFNPSMNGTVGTAAGSTQGWQGYVSRVTVAGSAADFTGVFTRPSQAAIAASKQDVLYSYANGGAVASSLYQGAGTGGPVLFSQNNPASTGALTAAFDALAIGYRQTGSVANVMDVNVVTFATNALPAITAQPAPTQVALVGTNAYLSVQTAGSSTYQWNKGGVPSTERTRPTCS